jgi:hypothetical protein
MYYNCPGDMTASLREALLRLPAMPTQEGDEGSPKSPSCHQQQLACEQPGTSREAEHPGMPLSPKGPAVQSVKSSKLHSGKSFCSESASCTPKSAIHRLKESVSMHNRGSYPGE